MMKTEEERRLIAEGLRKSLQETLPSNREPSQRFLSTVREKSLPEPIAIIGLSGYLPKTMSISEFWEALDKDISLIEEIPENRFDWEIIYDPTGNAPNMSHTKWGGFIPNIKAFDPSFFNVLPSEADVMDPRQRLLLMSVYHSLEDAGCAAESLKQSKTGVFIGEEGNEYAHILHDSGIDTGKGFGQAASMIANRISYFFDFRGPSETVNTMCSGGAVAMHRAVNALRSGEITYAVVGAANLILCPDPFVALSRMDQMSRIKSVHSFGENAGGYLRAEGVASVFLKSLSRAETDGDAIYAVIKNTSVNFNGKGGFSISSPNIAAHAELIQTCYRQVEVDPRNIQYIEAQGMGNPVADIAEWEACNHALRALAEEKGVPLTPGSCRVSTLKPMTGHMHSASAIGALFKIIRSLQTNTIHKILDFDEIHPDLDTKDQPCRLATETQEWAKGSIPRLAGLHSYGSGGNNAHILIEEYTPTPSTLLVEESPLILPISAKTPMAGAVCWSSR